ncbi:MAG: glycosyltransferase [Acidobacteriia bacterium]|nr:glycosyltransferase [Terriglobia bacterium]
MSIKTLHLTNCFHSESGGIATFYRELLKAAERLQREIRLVIPGASNRVESHGAYGRIYHVTACSSRLSPGYRLIMPQQYLLPHAPLRRILESEKPDLVECCDKYTMIYMAALLRRGWMLGGYRPSVVGLSCERMDDNVAHYLSAGPRAAWFSHWYMKHFYFPMFDHHIAVSEHVARELCTAARGHDVRRGVWVRPMGVECDLFRPLRRHPAKRQWLEALTGTPESACILLYAGRLAPEKNLGLLLDIMERLEAAAPGEFHLVIAGEGSRRASFEEESRRRLPGAVCFLGHVASREMLADIYANSDVFVHPNPGEPFGIAPLEAMASGLPLIAPNRGGLTSYADSSNAWLVDAKAEEYVRAIYQVRGNPSDTSRKLRNARATAESYQWSAVVSQFFELYDELHALVSGARSEPLLPPAFFSTRENQLEYEAT